MFQLTLEVKMSGEPRPEVTFYINGKAVEKTSKRVSSVLNLELTLKIACKSYAAHEMYRFPRSSYRATPAPTGWSSGKFVEKTLPSTPSVLSTRRATRGATLQFMCTHPKVWRCSG